MNRLHFQLSTTLRRQIHGVTVLEVLFAMFVVLFGLIGIVVLLPMAGRQAASSYDLTQGSAAMQNGQIELDSLELFEPSVDRPWWFQDDEYSTIPLPVLTPPTPRYLGFGNSFDLLNQQRRWYRSTTSMPDLLNIVKQRFYNNLTDPTPTAQEEFALELSRRNGYAQGFCIDPQFCAIELAESWRYPVAYDGRRGNGQGVFRRSRMPFYDETTGLGGSGLTSNAAWLFPRLMRVSFQAGLTAARFSNPVPEPLPLPPEVAAALVGSGGDLVIQSTTSDNSFGPLRYFAGVDASGAGATAQFMTAPSNRKVSWLATITPSEQSPLITDPTDYKVSIAVMVNRDTNFAAAPIPVVTGTPATSEDLYSTSEKIAFATSTTATSVSMTTLGDLPVSFQGGAFEIKLWSDERMEKSIRVGDSVLLSRRIVLGNRSVIVDDIPSLANLQVIHRHRWYRVVGVQEPPLTQATVWPRTIRIQGEPWDYPEMNATMRPGINYTASNPQTNAVYSLDGLSAVGTPPGGATNRAHTSAKINYSPVQLVDLTTTVTIVPNTIAVFERSLQLVQ